MLFGIAQLEREDAAKMRAWERCSWQRLVLVTVVLRRFYRSSPQPQKPIVPIVQNGSHDVSGQEPSVASAPRNYLPMKTCSKPKVDLNPSAHDRPYFLDIEKQASANLQRQTATVPAAPVAFQKWVGGAEVMQQLYS